MLFLVIVVVVVVVSGRGRSYSGGGCCGGYMGTYGATSDALQDMSCFSYLADAIQDNYEIVLISRRRPSGCGIVSHGSDMHNYSHVPSSVFL